MVPGIAGLVEMICFLFRFLTIIDSQKLIKPKLSTNKQVTKKFMCSVCYKISPQNKGLKCPSCDSLIHKKCTKLKWCDFLFKKIFQNTFWECNAYQNIKFLFVNSSNHEMQYLAFNFNNFNFSL